MSHDDDVRVMPGAAPRHRPISDYDVISAMVKRGGSFVRALGTACHLADASNLVKIKAAFPDVWAEYTGAARTMRQREQETSR